jgi:hypothetical protein
MCAVVVKVRQYLVLKGHGKWFVKSLGRLGVPYSKSGKSGKPAMVALFIKHRDPKTIWTFGQDSYPPITFDLALPPDRTTPS